MKLAIRRLTQIFLLLLLASTSLQAAELVKYKAQPRGNSVKIEGTSTLHDWTMESHMIGGTFQLDPAVTLDPTQETIPGVTDGKINAAADVVIPVRQLQSGKNTMDEIMQEAMNEKEHPRIAYKLKELKPASAAHKPNAPFLFHSTGELTVNGVKKEISFPVTITREGDSKLKITGKAPLKMSDFKVKAPRPKIGLGLIRTADEIMVSFEWIVAKSS